MKTLPILASAAILGLLVTNVVDSAEPRSITVKYADLDLNKAEGAAELFTRIKFAARKVCSPLDGRPPEGKRRHADCVQLALSNAVAKVDHPTLTTYAASRSDLKRSGAISVASGR